MQTFIVLYCVDYLEFMEKPQAFVCEADDYDDACEQCEKANHKCNVLWLHKVTEAYYSEESINTAMYAYFKNKV